MFRDIYQSGLFLVYQNKNYRILWTANVAAYISRAMQMTLLAWFVLVTTNSAWLVGLVGFFTSFPMFLLGLAGGILADSSDRKKILLTTQISNSVSVTMIIGLLYFDQANYWFAYISALVMGTAWALDMPSRRSLIHDFMGHDRVTSAIALDSMGMSASLGIGGSLAGVLIKLIGIPGSHVAVLLFNFIAIKLIYKLNVPVFRPVSRHRSTIISDLVSGFKYVASNSTLRSVIIITVLANLLLFPYLIMVPVIARNILGVGPGLMGLLQSTAGIGSILGAVTIASFPRVSYHGRIFVSGTLLAFFALILFSQSTYYVYSLAVLLFMGIGISGFGAMQSSMTVLISRANMRGKSLGVVSLAIGSGPFGSLLVGWLAERLGPSSALGILATTGIILVSLALLLSPTIRARTRQDIET